MHTAKDHVCKIDSAHSSKGASARFAREAVPHRDYLLHRAWRLTHQVVDAEDLVRDTLLKAFLSFTTFREGSNLRPWLYRIMHNTWVDGYRTAQRRPAEELSVDITDAQLSGRAAASADAFTSAEVRALEMLPSDAALALRQLPEDLREIVYYSDVQGYRNTEIATLLQIAPGTVGSRLHRGRARLRELLLESVGEDRPDENSGGTSSVGRVSASQE